MAATLTRVALAALAMVAFAVPAPAARRRVVHLKLGPFRIEANRDREVCQAVRVPRVAGMDVVAFEARSRTGRGVGSHHFVAYAYQGSASGEFPRGIVDDSGCNGFGPPDFFSGRAFLAGSGGEYQRGNWLITRGGFPGALALRMPSPADAPNDAVVVLNSHYFNDHPTRAGRALVKVTLVLGPSDPSKRPLRMLTELNASRDIFVAPGGTAAVEATWQADGKPNPATEGGANPAGDVCILYLSAHMHKRGTRFQVTYEEDGKEPEEILDTTDYLHPELAYFGRGRLLRAYTAENGHPRFRYRCVHENGTERVPMKLGCAPADGSIPGLRWADAEALGISSLESHARPCGAEGKNCEGRPCVAANLVFGPLSDDDMCVLPGALYEPLPGLPPEEACNPLAYR
jgi:hypothetical protein